jgi:hypothetical protein
LESHILAKGGADEGSVFAVGSLVILLCIGGSQATGTSPFQFFFMGVCGLGLAGLFFAFFLGLAISIIRVWVEAHKQDGRTLWQIIKQEYSAKKLAQTYKTVGDHIKKYWLNWWQSDRAAPYRRIADKVAVRTSGVVGQAREAWRAYLDADIDHIDHGDDF